MQPKWVTSSVGELESVKVKHIVQSSLLIDFPMNLI